MGDTVYRDRFGLKCKPFGNTPDPLFFYFSADHRQGLVTLSQSVPEKQTFATTSITTKATHQRISITRFSLKANSWNRSIKNWVFPLEMDQEGVIERSFKITSCGNKTKENQ
jgi:hypothetical protein